MNSLFDRRAFLRLCSACAAFLTEAAHPQAAKKTPITVDKSAVKNRKNFVAIQVKPFAWIDEGVDRLLDNLQQKGDVNTVWAYTYDYSLEHMTKDGPIPLPDHGVAGGPNFVGGAFYDYDP